MRVAFLFSVLAVTIMLTSTAPADSSEYPSESSVVFPEDGKASGRGYMMTNVIGPGTIEGGLITKHWKFFSKMLDECGSRGLDSCIGSKALDFVDGYMSKDSIPLYEGLALVRRNDVEQGEDAAKLSERIGLNGTEGAEAVAEQLVERFTRFLRTHSVQLRLPESDKREVAFGLDEGRKMKKMLLPIVLGIGLKVLGVLPLIFGGLALLSGSALFVSKLAFVVAALVGFSSVLNGVQALRGGSQNVRIPFLSQLTGGSPSISSAGAPTSYSTAAWQSGSTYGTGGSSSNNGWSRSMDAQQMAYGAQIPTEEQYYTNTN